MRDLSRQGSTPRFVVVVGHPDEHDDTRIDRTDDLAVHAHRRSGDPLHERSHPGNGSPAAGKVTLFAQTTENADGRKAKPPVRLPAPVPAWTKNGIRVPTGAFAATVTDAVNCVSLPASCCSP